MPEKDFTFSPDSIMSQVGQLSLPPPVTVRGKVMSVTDFTPPNSTVPKYTYGRLCGEDVEIGFRCPYTNAPKKDQLVVLKGALVLKPNRNGHGLDVTLEGEPIGLWEPADFRGTAALNLEKRGSLSLNSFFRNHGPDQLTIIGTHRGSLDMFSAMEGRTLKFIRTNVMESADLIKAVDQALDEDAQGIVFVRGGGEDLSFKVWNDPAFVHSLLQRPCAIYTAVGHSDTVSLTDKFSDEAFSTPTALGARILQILHHIEYDRQMDSQMTALHIELQSARQSITDLSARSKRYASEKSFWRLAFALAAIGAGYLAYLHFWNGKISF